MKKITCRIVVLFGAIILYSSFAELANAAEPYITNVVAKQRYPWNGLVDIDYEIIGSTNGIDGVYGCVSVDDLQHGQSCSAVTFIEKLDLKEGKHHAIWNASADVRMRTDNAILSISLAKPNLDWAKNVSVEDGVLHLSKGGGFRFTIEGYSGVLSAKVRGDTVERVMISALREGWAWSEEDLSNEFCQYTWTMREDKTERHEMAVYFDTPYYTGPERESWMEITDLRWNGELVPVCEIIPQSSSSSMPIMLDSRIGARYLSNTNVACSVAYDSVWVGASAAAEVVIADNGEEVKRVTGHGEVAWAPADYGRHVLTYTTYVGGVAQEEVYSATYDVIDCEGMGLPGLQRVTFTGSAYDASNVALGAEPIVTLNGEGMYDASLGAQSTYAYAGYMYFRENETYTFRGNFDDYSSVRVDNAEVVAQHAGDKSGSVGPFAESGWHKVDFRVSNNGGASGGGFGIQYQTDKDATWQKIVDDGSGAFLRTGPDYCGVVILKAAMWPSDPTIMDVVYKVQSPKEKVSVRALAYENGNRSFANAVPVLTFADGTGVNIGDDITANEEHTLSWQVAADWATDLTKVRFEVMVMDEGLLPLHFVTIPKTANHAAIQYSDTVLSSTAVMNALFWLYAGLDDDLSLSNGRLSGPFGELANGANVSNPAQTVSWLYQKMGYSMLTGANLNYVNSAARINLAPDGLRQFAVKTIK